MKRFHGFKVKFFLALPLNTDVYEMLKGNL